MLGISPVSFSNKSQSPSFGYSKRDVDNDISFYKEQVAEFDQFINENYIPDKMKKPIKFFRTIANGAIDGLAVFGSTLMLASFVKKSGAKINSNKYFNKIVNQAKPMVMKVPKAVSFISEKAVSAFNALVDSSLYKKFAATKLGKRLIVDASVIAVKTEDIASKAIKPLKNINADKAVKGTATVLGIGSGVTGAYETTMREDVRDEVDEGDDSDRRGSRDYEEDYDYYRESA